MIEAQQLPEVNKTVGPYASGGSLKSQLQTLLAKASDNLLSNRATLLTEEEYERRIL